MSTTYVVDVIAGDGIGQEVMPAGIACVEAIAFDFAVTWRHGDWGSERYRRTGRMMPVDAIEQLAGGDATLLGAVGAADIPDDVTLWGLLIPIRREFDQYVNLRPIRILPNVTSPLAGVAHVDIEGEYSESAARKFRGQPRETLDPGGRLHPPRHPAGRRIRRRQRRRTSTRCGRRQ